jgi:hypothetical protein
VTFSVMALGLLAGLSPRKPGFHPGLVLVRFVMDVLALGQVLIRVILFSPTTIILQMLRSNFRSHAALARETNGRSQRTLKSSDLSNMGGGEVLG